MRKSKSVLVYLAILMLVLSAFIGGCGQKQEASQSEGKKKLKVGLVFDVGGKGDKSFNDAASAGLEKAQNDFGGKIDVKAIEPSVGGENREGMLRLLAQDKYDLVFAVGFMFTDSVAKVAKDFLGTKFVLIDGSIDGLKPDGNINCLRFKEQEGSFLVGAAAALKSKTGKIGFVGGMRLPFIEKFEAGYIAGAKFVNPNIQVISDYIGTTEDAFKDPLKGKELAFKQIKSGVDAVYHASGASGFGVIEAAASQKVFAIGVDSDQSLNSPENQRSAILTSMIKRLDIGVYTVIKNMLEGKFQGGENNLGVAENGVTYAENEVNKAMIRDIKGKLEEIKEKIVKGEIKVPASKKEII